MEVQLTSEAQAILDRLVASSGSTASEIISISLECFLEPELDEATLAEINASLPEIRAAVARGEWIEADDAYFDRLRERILNGELRQARSA